MKKANKILSLFLSLLMIFSIIPMASITASAEIGSGTCGENLIWTFDDETGTLTISGTGEMYNNYDFKSNEFPWQSIISNIKNIVIKKGVTNISDYAFVNCSKLVNVSIGETVTSIGANSFYNCDNLVDVIIPNSVLHIGYSAFEGCDSLVNISTGDGVETIANHAFYSCDKLESVSFGNNVESIGEGSFAGCNLASVNIPENLISIGETAFGGNNLFYISVSPENMYYSNDIYGVLFNKEKTKLIRYPTASINEKYIIPEGVKLIDYYAFAGSRNLKEVVMPDSLTTILQSAFGTCGLLNVTIPNSVVYIGSYAFSGCNDLMSVTLSQSLTKINEYVFSSCSSLKSITIPNEVTSIGIHAFHNCNGMNSITIPDSLTIINDFAFAGCENLSCIYYTSTNENWNKIIVGSYNDSLLNATIHFNILSNKDIILLPNFNEFPDGTKLSVSTLETTEDSITYDITLINNGLKIQPNGNVTVKIPIPNSFDGDGLSVYRVEEDGTYTNMNAVLENSYMVFVTNHFSKYILTSEKPVVPEESEYNYTFSIQEPSTTTIRHKDGIKLHANIEGTAPAGSYVEWTASNGKFKTEEINDGNSLKIVSDSNGKTTFTATLYSADGEVLATDAIEMQSKAGFFDKLGSFFRSLFGGTKIHEN